MSQDITRVLIQSIRTAPYDTLRMSPVRLIFDLEKRILKVVNEGRYYIMGFDDIEKMNYYGLRNWWEIIITSKLPIGEIDV